MKIKEAIEIINGTTSTVSAEGTNYVLHIYHNNWGSYNGWFLSIPVDATNWDYIGVDWDCLSNIKPQDLARVMDVIQELLDTPVEERFPEKKYRLVVKRETSFHPKYVSNIITGFDELVFDLSKDEKEARIFGEKELNQIKEREPSLALAIDTMKEEVKDDED